MKGTLTKAVSRTNCAGSVTSTYRNRVPDGEIASMFRIFSDALLLSF